MSLNVFGTLTHKYPLPPTPEKKAWLTRSYETLEKCRNKPSYVNRPLHGFVSSAIAFDRELFSVTGLRRKSPDDRAQPSVFAPRQRIGRETPRVIVAVPWKRNDDCRLTTKTPKPQRLQRQKHDGHGHRAKFRGVNRHPRGKYCDWYFVSLHFTHDANKRRVTRSIWTEGATRVLRNTILCEHIYCVLSYYTYCSRELFLLRHVTPLNIYSYFYTHLKQKCNVKTIGLSKLIT